MNNVIFALLCLLGIHASASAQSAQCRESLKEAAKLSEEARDAVSAKNLSLAKSLQTRAAKWWSDAAKECPDKLRESALNNEQITRRNLAAVESGLQAEKRNDDRAHCEVMSDPAVNHFKRATEWLNSGQLQRAADSFELAEKSYQSAARLCRGVAAEAASKNAAIAAENRAKALAGLRDAAPNNERDHCRSSLLKARDLMRDGTNAEKAKEFKQAAELWARASDTLKPLEKECKEINQADLTRAIQDAQQQHAKNSCSFERGRFESTLENLLSAAATDLRFSQGLAEVETNANGILRNCKENGQPIAKVVLSDIPAMRSERVCFFRLADFSQRNPADVPLAGLAELGTLCQSAYAKAMFEALKKQLAAK